MNLVRVGIFLQDDEDRCYYSGVDCQDGSEEQEIATTLIALLSQSVPFEEIEPVTIEITKKNEKRASESEG